MTSDELRELDRRAVADLGLPSLVLMEHAGAGAAREIHAWLEQIGLPDSTAVLILAGPGNNGGDGFVVARWLALFGRRVRVLLCAPADRLRGDAAVEYAIVRSSGIEVRVEPALADLARALADAGAVVDALLGTGARSPIRGPIADWIEALNRASPGRLQVAALDLPSGLHPETGGGRPVVRADLTVSFVAPKVAFSTDAGRSAAGEVVIVPIGVPGSAYPAG